MHTSSDKSGGGKLSPEDVLELQELWEKLKEIDLEKARTPMSELIDRLKNNKEVKKALYKKRGPGRPRVHHKTKKKRKKAYWVQVAKPRRAARLATELRTPEGWWKHLNTSWKKRKVEVKLSYGEFVEYIYQPIIEGKGRLPIFQRIDPHKAIALANVVVVDSTTREVLFDGNEHVLRVGGFIL